MKTVKIGETIIGEGFPKIIVPLVGKTREELVTEAKNSKQLIVILSNGESIILKKLLIQKQQRFSLMI